MPHIPTKFFFKTPVLPATKQRKFGGCVYFDRQISYENEVHQRRKQNT